MRVENSHTWTPQHRYKTHVLRSPDSTISVLADTGLKGSNITVIRGSKILMTKEEETSTSEDKTSRRVVSRLVGFSGVSDLFW